MRIVSILIDRHGNDGILQIHPNKTGKQLLAKLKKEVGGGPDAEEDVFDDFVILEFILGKEPYNLREQEYMEY